jgi:hypothetical protein
MQTFRLMFCNVGAAVDAVPTHTLLTEALSLLEKLDQGHKLTAGRKELAIWGTPRYQSLTDY